MLGLAFVVKQMVSRDGNQKPNIVFILVDDMGWGDFSSFGFPTTSVTYLSGTGDFANNTGSYQESYALDSVTGDVVLKKNRAK